MMKKTPIYDLPIMIACCKTCPFKTNANGKMQDEAFAQQVTERTLFKSQQICHGTEDKNRKPNNRCKGSYDYNFEIYNRLNLAHLLK